MRRSHPLCIFFRHHKCATGWIDGILREVCFYMGWRFRIVHRPADFEAHGSLGRLVEAERPEVLAFTNADAAHLDDLPPFRGFHVIRDPRDVVVSGYLSHRYSHPTQDWPELAEHRRRLQQVSPEEGLFLEMNFSREWLAHMREWDYTRPDVLELKMEEVTADPVRSFLGVFAFLGILDHTDRGPVQRVYTDLLMHINMLNQRGRQRMPFRLPLVPMRFPQHYLSPCWVETIVQRKSFKHLSGGRERGHEDVMNHYRKGQPGDWRNHFRPEHAAYFQQTFGDLLIQLEYETDARWLASSRPDTPEALDPSRDLLQAGPA